MILDLERKYARAFFNVYPHVLHNDFLQRIEQLDIFFDSAKQSLFYLKLSSIPDSLKYDALMRIIARYKSEQELLPLVQLLMDHKRLYLIASVCKALVQLGKLLCGIVCATVTSYPALSYQQTIHIQALLEKRLGKTVELKTRVDRYLIAGFRVLGEYFLYERSVRQKIRRLAHDS